MRFKKNLTCSFNSTFIIQWFQIPVRHIIIYSLLKHVKLNLKLLNLFGTYFSLKNIHVYTMYYVSKKHDDYDFRFVRTTKEVFSYNDIQQNKE